MNGLLKLLGRAGKMWELGADFSSKRKLVFASLWLPLKKRLGLYPFVDDEVKIRRNGITFSFFVEDYFDILMLEEILHDAEYYFPEADLPMVIFDLGSNVGCSAIYFHLMYPQADIYAFEADPAIFEKLQRNAAQFEQIHAYNYAIADMDGEIPFFIYPEGKLSSSLIRRGENQQSIVVEAHSLDTLMDKLSISSIGLLKFDIEGSELDVFKNFSRLSAVHHLIGEVHPDLFESSPDTFLNLFTNFTITKKALGRSRFVMRATNPSL